MTLPGLLQLQHLSGDVNIIMGTQNYLRLLPPLFVQGLILLTASYLAEIVARKRFLQNILMYKQQNEIIKHKTINEKLQRKLLENMLPPGVVDKLQQQQKEDQLESAAAASKLLNNLSQRHLG